MPVHLWEKISLIKKTTKQLSQEIGRIPKQKEIAASLDMADESLQCIVKFALPVISLDTPIGSEDTVLADVIEYDGDTPETQLNKILQREELESILAILKPRYRQILKMRYGLDDGDEKTLEAIGQQYGLTRERIRQIINKAFIKLRDEEHIISREQKFIPQIVAPITQKSLILSNASKNTLNSEETNINQNFNQENNFGATVVREINLNQTIKTMEYNSTNLLEQLASLQQRFSQLSEKIIKAAAELQDPGIPLGEELILELGECRINFLRLRDRTLELAVNSEVSSVPKSSEILSSHAY